MQKPFKHSFGDLRPWPVCAQLDSEEESEAKRVWIQLVGYIKGTTLIRAQDVGHWKEDLHGLQQDLNGAVNMFSSQLPLRSKESVIDGLRQEQLAISKRSSATSTFHIRSPLNTPLETFALGQCVNNWSLRKSLRQRGFESNWLVKGSTLICASRCSTLNARTCTGSSKNVRGADWRWHGYAHCTYLLQVSALQERVENPFGDLHPRPACLPGFCAAVYLMDGLPSGTNNNNNGNWPITDICKGTHSDELQKPFKHSFGDLRPWPVCAQLDSEEESEAKRDRIQLVGYIKGTTLICAQDVGHWKEDLHGSNKIWMEQLTCSLLSCHCEARNPWLMAWDRSNWQFQKGAQQHRLSASKAL